MMVDTLTIARELKAADLPDGQAEAIAAAIGKSVTESTATKADLELAKQELQGGVAAVRSDLELVKQELRSDLASVRADMERMRNQLILWFSSSQLALAGLIIALIKL